MSLLQELIQNREQQSKYLQNVDLSNRHYKVLPADLPTKRQSFNCEENQLTSLKGSPQILGFGFNCSNNKLTSLEGGPIHVGGNYNCENNFLTSLEGIAPIIGINVFCTDNKITSLHNIHKHIKQMNGGFFIDDNQLESNVLGLLKIPGCNFVRFYNRDIQEILNKYLPLGDLIDCQEELIEAGFPEYAQL